MKVLETTDLEQKFQDKIDREVKIEPNDCVHIYDDFYAKLSKGSIVCKESVSKFNTILRKK